MNYKTVLTLLLFLMLFLPAPSLQAQKVEEEPSETELLQTLQENPQEKKKKKTVEIDQNFFIGLGINLFTVFLIILVIYHPNYKKMDCVFTFIIFNLVIFLLTFVLKYVKLSVGTAFGMFAVFSMLRYRTEGLSLKDMTYLFIFIAIGLLSAIQLEVYKILVIHGVIFAGVFILDGNLFVKREFSKSIQYEKIELIKNGKQEELIRDLRERTGLGIHRITVNKINFLKDTATVRIYYYDKV